MNRIMKKKEMKLNFNNLSGFLLKNERDFNKTNSL